MSTKKKQQKISSRPKIEKPRVRNAQKSDDLDSPMDVEFGPPTGVDLPPEARDLLGKSCDWTDCSCRINPNVTCQVFRVIQGMVPAMILNASKGDLILCPGDGTGSIGALLGALQMPQVYSHMGIMMDKGMNIRHCTAVASRMQAYPVGGTFDLPLPIDGFEQDKVTYGWPGTITQSVDEAFAATMPGSFLTVPKDQSAPYLYCDRDNGKTPFTEENPDNFCFKMAELSFVPVFGLGGDRRDPLVVRPCRGALSEHPEIRSIVEDVAEEVKGIAAHYRFYAYTNATIAEDPAYQSAGSMPLYRWDPGETMWKPIEDLLFDPLNPCLTPAQQSPVKFTVPAVCSSLIWLAVRRYNSRNHKFQIVLDTYYPPTVSSPLEPDCLRTIPSPSMGATPDPAGITPDGCYFFTEADRINVANSFHAGLKQDVQDTINSTIDGPWHSIATYIESHDAVSIPLLFSIGFVFGAAEAALWSVAGLSVLLGVSKASAKLIIDVFTSMPEHIANQLVNAFAVDNAGSADYTSDAWKSPGVGRAVGPDDTIWFWQTDDLV